jgi:Lrp/AsnC family leucine-responsive transcriptional regulator
MEEAGYIMGYTARLDRGKLGYPVTAFVAVRYPPSDGIASEPPVEELAANPNVLECHHVAGEDCYILKVAAESLGSLEQVLRLVREFGRPASTRTTIVLSSVFEKAGITPVELD